MQHLCALEYFFCPKRGRSHALCSEWYSLKHLWLLFCLYEHQSIKRTQHCPLSLCHSMSTPQRGGHSFHICSSNQNILENVNWLLLLFFQACPVQVSSVYHPYSEYYYNRHATYTNNVTNVNKVSVARGGWCFGRYFNISGCVLSLRGSAATGWPEALFLKVAMC